MNAIKENSNGTLEAVRAAVKRHGASREELIPILTDINKSVGFLPAEALEEISRLIHVPRSQLFSVATFYRMLSTKKMGRHVVQFCESAPCHVVGGRQVWETLQSELGLEPGETSPDDRWTLVTVSCLGVCGIGPGVVIDDEMYGKVTPELIPGILARYA